MTLWDFSDTFVTMDLSFFYWDGREVLALTGAPGVSAAANAIVSVS